jgi:hypothetical protein
MRRDRGAGGVEMSRERIFREVDSERKRQDAKWGVQNHPVRPEDSEAIEYFHQSVKIAKEKCDEHAKDGTLTWWHIVREEIFEAMDETTPEGQRYELIQLAAVAVSMIECIDRKKIPL